MDKIEPPRLSYWNGFYSYDRTNEMGDPDLKRITTWIKRTHNLFQNSNYPILLFKINGN
jgi:hypothetical protein